MNNLDNITKLTLEHLTNDFKINLICDQIDGTKVIINGKFDEVLPKNIGLKASDMFKKLIEEIKTSKKDVPSGISKDSNGFVQLLIIQILPMVFKISPSRICNIIHSIDETNLSETSPFSVSFIITDKKNRDNQASNQNYNLTYDYLSHECIAEWMTYEFNKATSLLDIFNQNISFPKSLESSTCKALNRPNVPVIISPNENSSRSSNVCVTVLPDGRIRVPAGVDFNVLPDGRILDASGISLSPCVNIPPAGSIPRSSNTIISPDGSFRFLSAVTLSRPVIISPDYTEDFSATIKPIPDAKKEQEKDQGLEKEQSPPESNTWLYVVIGIVFIILAIGGGIWYMNRPSKVSSTKMNGGIFNIGE